MHSSGNASSLPLVGGAPEPTINQLSKPGRRASRFPKLDVPVTEINNSAIWTAFKAAPLRRLSDTTHILKPLSIELSFQILLTYT